MDDLPESGELFSQSQVTEDSSPSPSSLATPVNRRQPAKISPTVIPGRKPAKPVLVSGTKTTLEEPTELTSDEPKPKRQHTEHSRTNKHKKRKCNLSL